MNEIEEKVLGGDQILPNETASGTQQVTVKDIATSLNQILGDEPTEEDIKELKEDLGMDPNYMRNLLFGKD